MKFPLSWLKEYVDFDDTAAGLADRLTFAGLEVERVETIGGTFEGVVVGEVIQIAPHPNADKLRLCTVNYGAADPLQVVCGAPNVVTGGKYPFATVGTTLPSGIKLKKAKIRGVESLGMLCAPDELGLGESHSGLLVLDAALRPGTTLGEVLGPPETVFELEITPNRPDCLSIIGIAREVAAIYGKPLKMPDEELRETDCPAGMQIAVDVQDSVRCPRYTARLLRNAQPGPSPAWMQRRLEACGLRPVNNLVDITNYVLLETGHPLHAFDCTLINGSRIIVRRAAAGEPFTALDGSQHELTDDMLVIADPEKAVALAGIMGGANSDIRPDTSTVLLESAAFESSGIRRTAKALGLYTESSYRFQRGVNPDTVAWAGRRAAALMAGLAGAEVCRCAADVYPAPKPVRRVAVRQSAVNRLIGLHLSADETDGLLQRLGISAAERRDDETVYDIPTFRDDLEREVDLIEEVARLHGLDRIPEKTPAATIVPGAKDDRSRAIRDLRRTLAGLGAREIMNYTLVSHALLDLFGRGSRDKREELPHPISADQSVLRTSLIPQMAESIGRNKSRQVDEVIFFEAGRTFRRTENGPVQSENVCLGLTGPAGRGPLDKRRAVSDEEAFLWIKGLAEQMLAAQQVPQVTFAPCDDEWFEPGRALTVRSGNTPVGVLGLLPSAVRKEWRLNDPAAAAEFDLDALIAHTQRIEPVADLPQYPGVERDFAFITGETVRHEDILAAIQSAAPAELERVQLFDIFRGKSIGAGRKSLAFSFFYRSASGTLTDEKVNAMHQAIGSRVCAAVSAVIREG